MPKKKYIPKFKKNKHKENILVVAEKNKDEEEFLWLKNINYSCRYDSFLLIYALSIKNLIIKLN